MDSCHIFNFLFGTKKATTELSKCLYNITGQKKSKNCSPTKNDSDNHASTTTNHDSKSQNSHDSTNKQNQPPLSPLKQLQAKLIGLTPSFNNLDNSINKRSNQNATKSKEQEIDCNLKRGTYRARLVKLVEEEDLLVDENNNTNNDIKINESSVSIVEDPIESIAHDLETTGSNIENDDDYRELVQKSNKNFSFDDKKLCLDNNNNNVEKIISEIIIDDNNNINNINYSNNNNNNMQLRMNSTNKTTFKPVVMYSDDDLEEEKQKFVASSAEVYKLVSEYGEARAKLRRVSSITYDREIINHMDESDDTIKLDKENNDKEIYQDNNCQAKRSIFVRNIVKSIESNGKFDEIDLAQQKQQQYGYTKPVTLVKPMPPPTPPKPNISITNSSYLKDQNKFITYQTRLEKPSSIQELFQDEKFLTRFFFNKLEPLDRCVAAQVCRLWRDILYANQTYWKDLINVIDCTQLRREHLAECIINTLQSAKLKQQQKIMTKEELNKDKNNASNINYRVEGQKTNPVDFYFDFDQDDVWKIQELCNKFTTNHHRNHSQLNRQQMIKSESNEQTNCNSNANINGINNNINNNFMTSSKSSSIPSQISSTLSSFSISSILSPLSESNRIESIKEKLYTSLDDRGFDALCLFGATDDDIEDIVYKIPTGAHKRITVCRLNNCSLSDRGIDLLIRTFNEIEELELTGCNEITNAIDLKPLINMKRLIITDCINVADGIAQNLLPVANQLNELTIQAYHLTDTFLEYLSLNSDIDRLTKLELPNCKEITNQSLITLAKHFTQLEFLSISGSTKISDEGIEILAEQAKRLRSLDLSWCTRITDASLECIACDLGDTLTDLILDRNVHITDIGLSYLSTMSSLTLLHIRWCSRITDLGLESILGLRSLKYLSLAGLHQITARSLLCLVETELAEIELTNCPAVNNDLILFLSAQLPNCNIIF